MKDKVSINATQKGQLRASKAGLILGDFFFSCIKQKTEVLCACLHALSTLGKT